MTSHRPPRLAVFLLRHALPDEDPLVGDLLEAYPSRPSSWWFWRQTLGAVVMAGRRRERARQLQQARPLSLGASPPPLPPQRRLPRQPVNLTASPIYGVGGLGLLVFGIVVFLVRPELWWAALVAAVGGMLLGAVLLLLRRRERADVTVTLRT